MLFQGRSGVPGASFKQQMGQFRHTIANLDHHVTLWEATIRRKPSGLRWFTPGELLHLPLSTATRKALRAYLGGLLGRDGVLLLPTVPGPAPLLASTDEELESTRAQSLRLLCLSGLSGFPQVTIPAGLQDGAAPSLQSVARRTLAFDLETGAAVGK